MHGLLGLNRLDMPKILHFEMSGLSKPKCLKIETPLKVTEANEVDSEH